MIEGIVISLKILVIGMGNRGSKSVFLQRDTVKEQRVDGSSVIFRIAVRCTLVAGESRFLELKKNLFIKARCGAFRVNSSMIKYSNLSSTKRDKFTNQIYI